MERAGNIQNGNGRIRYSLQLIPMNLDLCELAVLLSAISPAHLSCGLVGSVSKFSFPSSSYTAAPFFKPLDPYPSPLLSCPSTSSSPPSPPPSPQPKPTAQTTLVQIHSLSTTPETGPLTTYPSRHLLPEHDPLPRHPRPPHPQQRHKHAGHHFLPLRHAREPEWAPLTPRARKGINQCHLQV